MAGFPVVQLQPTLLERIVTKCEWKSYFRLQQTCKGMEEFSRTNRNIHVSLPKTWFLHWEKEKKDEDVYKRWDEEKEEVGPHQLYWLCGSKPPNTPDKRVQGLYGVRMAELRFRSKITEEFEQLCDILKKNNVTCSFLAFHLPTYKTSYLAKEQCEELLKILKPTSVAMEGTESNRFEALIPLKQLERACLIMDSGNTLVAVEKFLLKTEDVELNIIGQCTPEQQFKLLNTILQAIYSEPPSTPRSFRIYLKDDRWISAPAMLEKLRSAYLTLEIKLDRGEDLLYCDMPLANEATCEVELGTFRSRIYYKPKRAV